MPVMDGVELCRKIRSSKTPGYVYFILLTGKDKKEDIIRGLESGADDYVTKPFIKDELNVRVRAGERILELERELTEKNKQLQLLNSKLEEIAWIDPLMEIGNRRSFYESIRKMHHRGCRYAQGYGIIMCDIDYFKKYNDRYGHIEGDNILKTVADTIKKTLRESDEVFRYGGEEIVMLLPEQDLKDTIAAAERVRKAIEALKIEHKGSEFGFLTVSCGVSAFDINAKDNRWEDMLNRADQALYNAKTRGRNRVDIKKDNEG
jgi:diguanylate cyclase (GGDEF)-like protein